MKKQLLAVMLGATMLAACGSDTARDVAVAEPTEAEIMARCSDRTKLKNFINTVLDAQTREPILRFNEHEYGHIQHSECLWSWVGHFETRQGRQYFVITFEVNPYDWSTEVYFLRGFANQPDFAFFIHNDRNTPLWHPDYFHER